MSQSDNLLKKATEAPYPYGFSSPIAQDVLRAGLNEDVIRLISKKKKEPLWLLQWRLAAFSHWQKMKEPTWPNLQYPPINYQKISYYAEPKQKATPQSLADLDPDILATFEKLGIPLEEQKRLAGIAVDAVLDSVSVKTTFEEELKKKGIIFCSLSQAIQKHPHLVRQNIGRVVSMKDNFFAALNAAVFSDGSFCYIPPGIRCPMELSTYFRINAANTGQFERTLIIAQPHSYVSYLEGCTAPMRDTHQLHAAVVEIIAEEKAEVRYATIQNWYPGDATGKGGVYNFVTKRGICAGDHAKIAWVQLETGSAITWKYPSCILKGDRSIGEFYSVAITKNHQQADTGTKMIHLGRQTRSHVISKGISAGHSQNTYRGLVKISPQASDAYNFSQCDSLLIGNQCSAHTIPYILASHHTATVQHEATTSKMDEEQLLYCQQRGIGLEAAHSLIATGFCKEVLSKLPMEFAIEAQKLLAITLEGSVG